MKKIINYKKLYEDEKKEREYTVNRSHEYASKANELQKKLDSIESSRMNKYEENSNLQDRHAEVLLEIIRWLANPHTTAYPFASHKDQRGDDRGGNMMSVRYPLKNRF